MIRPYLHTALLLSLALFSSACCNGGSPGSKADPPPAASASVGGIPLPELVGTYTGDWGTMHLVFVGTEARAAYDHDEGLFVGRIVDGKVRGTWCQGAKRGSAEFAFAKVRGSVSLDGRWNYATDPSTWNDDWDLVRQAKPNAVLATKAATAVCR